MPTPTSMSSPKTPFWKEVPFILTALAIIAGIVLSIVSWTQFCTKACQEIHEYLLFGLPFEPFGLLFFATAGTLHLLSRRYNSLAHVVLWIFMGGFGAEIMLIVIQKYAVGQWCPICLSIALSVTVGLIGCLIKYRKTLYQKIQQESRRKALKEIAVGLTCFPMACLGFMVIFLGAAKPIAPHSYRPEPFGNLASNVEVYLFTDWFCPSCKKIEEKMTAMYPQIIKKAALIFVDRPIHAESMNFIPYNLSLMRYHKQEYFQVRPLLHALAEKKKAPSPTDVQTAIAPLGIAYQQMEYADVQATLKYFDWLAQTYNIAGTPTMLIVDKQDAKHPTKLFGGKAIADANLLQLIDNKFKPTSKQLDLQPTP